MNLDFKNYIQSYIDKCNIVLSSGDYNEAKALQELIISSFSNYIPNLAKSLDFKLPNQDKKVNYVGNILLLREKLEGFKLTYKYEEDENKDKPKNNIVLHNNNIIKESGNSTNTSSNTNTQNQTVNNTFDIKAELDKVRAEVEADEVLGEEDKEEINEKLNEIEEVMNGSPTNNEKWKKLKGVVNWVTTKGFKIGKMIMPLITKALFPEE